MTRRDWGKRTSEGKNKTPRFCKLHPMSMLDVLHQMAPLGSRTKKVPHKLTQQILSFLKTNCTKVGFYHTFCQRYRSEHIVLSQSQHFSSLSYIVQKVSLESRCRVAHLLTVSRSILTFYDSPVACGGPPKGALCPLFRMHIIYFHQDYL